MSSPQHVLENQAVNEPMVQEMFRLVGYHIPTNAELEPMCQMLNIPLEKAKTLLYKDGVYRKILSKKCLEKQFKFDKIKERGNWIDEITDELSPADTRMLIQYEEEFAACEEFDRIFPTNKTHNYFVFFKDVSYYDKLLDGIEHLTENSYGERDNIIQEVRFSWME